MPAGPRCSPARCSDILSVLPVCALTWSPWPLQLADASRTLRVPPHIAPLISPAHSGDVSSPPQPTSSSLQPMTHLPTPHHHSQPPTPVILFSPTAMRIPFPFPIACPCSLRVLEERMYLAAFPSSEGSSLSPSSLEMISAGPLFHSISGYLQSVRYGLAL